MKRARYTFLVLAALLPSCLDGGESPDIAGASNLVAALEVATEDGNAAYRFRFEAITDGPIMTLVEAPHGYPAVVIPTECALDTFLRVADPLADVPEALVSACGVPLADGGRRARRDFDPTFVAHELNFDALTLEFEPSAKKDGPRRRCGKPDFEKRLGELQELAAYQPIVPVNCVPTCDVMVFWNADECGYVDGEGAIINICSNADHLFFLSAYGPYGNECLEAGTPDCDYQPNPACDHTEWVIGDWGPYGSWSRHSLGNKTTRVRTEVETCSDETTRGTWQHKENEADPWSASKAVSFGANTTGTLVLSAGWDGQDRWRGWDFRISAEGEKFHVATAWVELEGRNRFTCPLGI